MSTTIAIIIVLIIALIVIIGAVIAYRSMSVKDTPAKDTPANDGTPIEYIPDGYVEEPSFVDGTPPRPKAFRYINIKQNSFDKRLKFAELKILDSDNRSFMGAAELFAPMGNAFSLRNGNIKDILFDSGSLYDYPVGKYTEPFLSVDLLRDREIASMAFINSEASLMGAEVTLINSDKTYTEIYTLNGARNPRLSIKPTPPKPAPPTPTIAPDSRYIEIRRNVTNESMMKFAELQIWAKTPEGDKVNVARTATVTVNRGNAQALIDADLQTEYDSGPHRNRDGPYIHVDLGQEYDLSSIEFVNTAYPISGASVRVYNTDESKSAYYTVGAGNNPVINLDAN